MLPPETVWPWNIPSKISSWQRCSPERTSPVSMMVESSTDSTRAVHRSASWYTSAPSNPVGNNNKIKIASRHTTTGAW